MDMDRRVFVAICSTLMIIAFIFNATLLFLVLSKKTTKIGHLRILFFFMALMNAIYSATEGISAYYWYRDEGLFVVIPSSPIGMGSCSMILAYLFTFSMFSQLHLITATFTYRDSVVCNVSRLLNIYAMRYTSHVMATVAVSTLAAFTIWFVETATPSPDLRIRIRFALERVLPDADFDSLFIVANDAGDLAGLAPITVLLVAFCCMIMVMIVCTFRINRQVCQSASSEKSRALHRQVLLLLVLQGLNPILFHYLPMIAISLSLFIPSANLSFMGPIARYLFLFPPLLNPLIAMYFTTEYRRTLQRWFHIRSKRISFVDQLPYATDPPPNNKTSDPE